MGDFESFSAPESVNQGSTAESFRLFQERMKVAAAQIQASQKKEQKQKKKEDDLAKILSDFIKSSEDDLLIELISELLAINLPAIFIVSLIILNFPELQEVTGFKLLEYPSYSDKEVASSTTLPDLYHENKTLSLKVKIALDSWIQEITKTIQAHPEKITNHALRLDRKVKPEVLNLADYILTSYLNSQEFYTLSDANRQFIQICLQGIFDSLLRDQPALLE